MDEQVQTGIRISKAAYDHLNAMAEYDKRRPTTSEIEFIIERAWTTHPANEDQEPPAQTKGKR